MPSGPRQSQSEPAVEAQGAQEGRELEWVLPDPSKPRRPLREDVAGGELPSQLAKEQGRKPLSPEHPIPKQQLVEADKRCRKRLAALARGHIIKLRQERQRMACEWLEEYSIRVASAKLRGTGLNTFRAEYIQ